MTFSSRSPRPLSAPFKGAPPAVIAASLFVVGGIAWVLVTDLLLYRLVTDVRTLGRLETAKGWLFVCVAALLVYVTTAYTFASLARAEALLREILQSIADGVLLVGGANRTVLDANPAALRILGVEKKEDVVGLDAQQFSRTFHLATSDGQIVMPHRYSSQRALDGELVSPYEAVIHPRQGPPRWLTVTAAPVRSRHDGPVELAVSVMRDATSEVELQRMRDAFYAGAAHALKTPISTIKAHAQLLRHRAHEDDRAVSAAIDRQCTRIDRTVQNMLVLSRIRSHTFQLTPRDVDLVSVVEAAVADEITASDGARISLAVNVRARVFGDAERLRCAIRNHIAAATQRASAGSTVLVRLTTRFDDHARVSTTIMGSSHGAGQGLDDEIVLGLHVSDGVIDAHAGRRGIERDESGHETFWFELPITLPLSRPRSEDYDIADDDLYAGGRRNV